MNFPVYTVRGGAVARGAEVTSFALKGAGVEIPAVVVGEAGRGRSTGVLPVSGGRVDRVLTAAVGVTRSGRPKLLVREEEEGWSPDAVLVVLRSPIGFRGKNRHSGDIRGWRCASIACNERDEQPLPVPEECPFCGAKPNGYWDGPVKLFHEFPGEVLVEGRIAQGDAGRMGSGRQLVALIPRDTVFRVGIGGRLYGKPSAFYYMWNGEELLAATWEERAVSDLF